MFLFLKNKIINTDDISCIEYFYAKSDEYKHGFKITFKTNRVEYLEYDYDQKQQFDFDVEKVIKKLIKL